MKQFFFQYTIRMKFQKCQPIKFVSNAVWSFPWKLSLSMYLNLELSNVALFPLLVVSNVLPWFWTLILSPLNLVIFRHYISLTWSPYLEHYFSIRLECHSLYIYHLFYLVKEVVLLSDSKKLLWNKKYIRIPSYRIYKI